MSNGSNPPAMGRCASCGNHVELTRTGALRSHLPDGRKNAGGNIDLRCVGSGCQPSSRFP